MQDDLLLLEKLKNIRTIESIIYRINKLKQMSKNFCLI
jgi:hypothetical protein